MPVPVRMSTPSARWRSATTEAISSGTPRINTRGSASMTVTFAPRFVALAASSSPMKPPPMTTTRMPRESSRRMASASSKLRKVTQRGPASAASGNCLGTAPVARRSLS